MAATHAGCKVPGNLIVAFKGDYFLLENDDYYRTASKWIEGAERSGSRDRAERLRRMLKPSNGNDFGIGQPVQLYEKSANDGTTMLLDVDELSAIHDAQYVLTCESSQESSPWSSKQATEQQIAEIMNRGRQRWHGFQTSTNPVYAASQKVIHNVSEQFGGADQEVSTALAQAERLLRGLVIPRLNAVGRQKLADQSATLKDLFEYEDGYPQNRFLTEEEVTPLKCLLDKAPTWFRYYGNQIRSRLSKKAYELFHGYFPPESFMPPKEKKLTERPPVLESFLAVAVRDIGRWIDKNDAKRKSADKKEPRGGWWVIDDGEYVCIRTKELRGFLVKEHGDADRVLGLLRDAGHLRVGKRRHYDDRLYITRIDRPRMVCIHRKAFDVPE